MDIGILESVHHAGSYLRYPLLKLLLECTGRFTRSIERRVPVL